jgi:O-antigen ligase
MSASRYEIPIIDLTAIGKIFIYVSLAFTITNFIPLSVSFVIFFFLAAPVLFPRLLYSKVDVVVWSLLAIYTYFLVWLLVYSPRALLEYEFYRRDGNFFITFFPVLLFPFFRINVDLKQILRCLLLWALVLSSASYFFHFLFPTKPIFHGLFHAHNAAGGYFAMLCAFATGLFMAERRWFDLFTLIAFGFLLLETDSRGSLLGLIMASMLLVPVLRSARWVLFVVALVSLLILTVIYLHPVWVMNGEAPAGFKVDYVDFLFPIDRAYTIVDRVFFLWPRAVDSWLKSPIFGVGYGAYNDLPYIFRGWDYLISINQPKDLVYSDAHSHNTYLHLLAETGLVGLLLVIFFVKSLEAKILAQYDLGLRNGFQLALWVAIWSSFSEHRLFTPSQMLPFTLLTGLLMARCQKDRAMTM